MTTSDLLKALWMKLHLRGTLFGNKLEQFDKAYQVKDPWQMNSAREQDRFLQTNRIIEQEIGPLASLLEIGCGEGHHTEHLARICRQLYGFDVSETAVARARMRCPSALLSVEELSSYQPPVDVSKFDLVVACEVLYYLKDVPAAIARMNALGKACLVSYFESGPHILDPFFSGIVDKKTRTILVGDATWKVVWWRPVPAAVS